MANSASSPLLRAGTASAATAKSVVGHLRANLVAFLLPALLIAGYLLQLGIPAVAEKGMLSQFRPHWWQYFSYSFLSANPAHLAFGALALYVILSEFARGIRPLALLLLFVALAALAALCYHHWLMPRHSKLVGASGGTYALLGFCGGWRPRDRIGLPRIPFGIPIPVGVAVVVAAEAALAHFWLPTLGWILHALGFAIGAATGFVALGIRIIFERATDSQAVRRLLETPDYAWETE